MPELQATAQLACVGKQDLCGQPVERKQSARHRADSQDDHGKVAPLVKATHLGLAACCVLAGQLFLGCDQPPLDVEQKAAARRAVERKNAEERNNAAVAALRLQLAEALAFDASNVSFTVEKNRHPGDDFGDDFVTCDVVFEAEPSPPIIINKVVLKSLAGVVSDDMSTDVLATAWVGDRKVGDSFSYDASAKRIMTFYELMGVKTTSFQSKTYSVELQESPSFTGGEAVVELYIIFPRTPSQAVANKAIVSEIKRFIQNYPSLTAYVVVGDPRVKATWFHMSDGDGEGSFVMGKVNPVTRRITTRRGKVLGTVP